MKIAFFVTCGRGMNYFVVKELSGLSKIHNLESTDGKVFFEVLENEDDLPNSNLKFLLNIKSAERLFVTICKSESGRNAADNLVKSQLNVWKQACDIWSMLQNGQPTDTSEASLQPSFSPKRKKMDPITFRMSCKSAGKISKVLSIQHISKMIKEDIQNNLDWQPDFKNPMLEIYVHLNDDFLVIGLPAHKIPLSKRPYLKSIKLRSTVCWAMAQSAGIIAGDIVLDPMCGAGTVIIEALKSCNVECFIGIDSSLDQLKQTIENCNFAKVFSATNLMLGSVEALPIKSECIDVLLCDFPFGLKHGTIEQVKALMPKALQEMNRVCNVGGRIVILISHQLVDFLIENISGLFPRKVSNPLIPVKCQILSATSESQSTNPCPLECLNFVWWKQLSRNYVKLGQLDAYICTFLKRKRM